MNKDVETRSQFSAWTRTTVAIVVGGALGFLLVALSGILALQREGLLGGAVLGPLSNEPILIIGQKAPYVYILGSALLGALLLCAFLRRASGFQLVRATN